MKIGVIGSGNIGGTLARRLAQVGHAVAVSNSRGPHTLRELAADLGPNGAAMTAADAVRFGDVVVVAVPFGKYRDLPVEGTGGGVVVDATNYYPDRDGQFTELDADLTTSSELVQRHFPEAPVVKAFNAIYWSHLRDFGRANGDRDRIGIPISGDDPLAKDIVSTIIDELGFDAVDAGGLAEGGRKHQPGTTVYTADMHTNQLYATLT